MFQKALKIFFKKQINVLLCTEEWRHKLLFTLYKWVEEKQLIISGYCFFKHCEKSLPNMFRKSVMFSFQTSGFAEDCSSRSPPKWQTVDWYFKVWKKSTRFSLAVHNRNLNVCNLFLLKVCDSLMVMPSQDYFNQSGTMLTRKLNVQISGLRI